MIDDIERWLGAVEVKLRAHLREEGNPLADDTTWKLQIRPELLCCECGKLLDGAFIGVGGDARGNRFAHTECYEKIR